MRRSQILKFVKILTILNLSKTLKSKYLENKNIAFSSNKKIHAWYIKGYIMTKISFLAEVA